MRYDFMLCPRCVHYKWKEVNDSSQYEDFCKIHGFLNSLDERGRIQCPDFERRKKGKR